MLRIDEAPAIEGQHRPEPEPPGGMARPATRRSLPPTDTPLNAIVAATGEAPAKNCRSTDRLETAPVTGANRPLTARQAVAWDRFKCSARHFAHSSHSVPPEPLGEDASMGEVDAACTACGTFDGQKKNHHGSPCPSARTTSSVTAKQQSASWSPCRARSGARPQSQESASCPPARLR